ncbi:50S ribosomal protein L23 [Candidatus Gracilibacteria bacterium]|nr:50S ribosomal protein L23 [Candidatus Gracilibacteria bacterium]
MLRIETVLVQPVITEKTVAMVGKYTFKVHSDATKSDVVKAVKAFYGADVAKVNMTSSGEKTKLAGRGRVVRRRSRSRKAVVTLKTGQTLNFNDFK